MKTVLVSVISGQTIPNFLLIKELSGQYDSQIFITTHDMEGRGNPADSRSIWIEKAAGIEPGSTRRIKVIEDSWQDISTKLQELDNESEKRYIVNLTGGTKIMTLAVFEFFAHRNNTIYYIPFPKNEYHELFPDRNRCHILKYHCNLKEYLLAHGLYYTQNEFRLAERAKTLAFFEKVRIANFDFQSIPEIVFAHELVNKSEKSYYSGIWFEEYVYHTLIEELKLSASNIALGVKLYRNPDEPENDNEYDVMYVRANTLFVIECKASVGKVQKSGTDKYLYKLGAITKDFGLKVNTYLFTLTNLSNGNGQILKNLEKRQRILGIKGIFDRKFFEKQKDFINYLK